jgi:putative addiction module component (TIGR02574 family)
VAWQSERIGGGDPYELSAIFDLSPSAKLQLVEDLWDSLAAAPEAVPVHDWQKQELARKSESTEKAQSLLQILLRKKGLVRISNDLVFHQSAIGKPRTMLAECKGSRFGGAELKEWTGVSRKYAIPLLEYMDREKITRRDGDERVVL